MLLIEDADQDVLSEHILARRFDVAICRNDQVRSTAPLLVHQIFNVTRGDLRSINLSSPIRAELELEVFGREYLISQLIKGVQSYPLVIFIDDFGLYRNMYRSITGVYAMPAGLPVSERQKSFNAYTIALGPHGSEFNDVMNCLHTSLGNMDRGCILEINGHKQAAWAPILAYLGDMKQQQASGGFLGLRANYCCRFCDAGLHNRGDLQRDILLHGRYHHEVFTIRKKSLAIKGKTKRLAYLTRNGLKPESSALQTLTPALDLIMSCPPDPAHSEYYGLVRRLYPFLYTKILTKRAAEEFTAALHCFPFPPGWGRIQSPAIHMASWSMSECARASVVIPLLFRCWLRNRHVRQPFRNGLKVQIPKERRHCASDEDLIVFCFGKLAWSNTLISSFELFLKDRQEFHSQIVNAQQCFLGLMNAAQNPK